YPPLVGQVSHLVLTSSPLYSSPEGDFRARLACLIHAASVHSEPGSNSPNENLGSAYAENFHRSRPTQAAVTPAAILMLDLGASQRICGTLSLFRFQRTAGILSNSRSGVFGPFRLPSGRRQNSLLSNRRAPC